VIPQIILSGVMVKFEKLNPNISSPIDIPWYGEIITARWAYEAAAVYQFKDNRYNSLFYKYWKAQSIAQFRQRYWITEINNKIDYVERNSSNPENREELLRNLRVIRNEITKENRLNEFVQLEDPDRINEGNLNVTLYADVRDYLDEVKSYYNKLNNKASEAEDNLKEEMQAGVDGKDRFLKLKRDYNNKQLQDFVTNKDAIDRFIEYKDNLYQKIDPIYLDPQQKFLKAHFYAPRKQIFGNYYDTFWVNIIVIWITTIGFYVILYYRLFKKFLDAMEHVGDRINLGSKE
jgi:hypothetical protein